MLLRMPAAFGSRITAHPAVPTDVRAVILVLSGSLNPVHRSHVALLKAVRRALESRVLPDGRPAFVVLSGVVVPSSEEYVNGKLGAEALPLGTRVALAQAAVDEDGDGWMGVAPWEVASGNKCCERVLKQLQHEHDTKEEEEEAAAAPLSVLARFPHVEALAVYGSDFLLRARGCLRRPTLIFSRRDSEGSADMAHELVTRSQAESIVHPSFMYLTDVNHEVPELSSTLVRRLQAAVAEGADTAAAEQLETLLHKSVARLLLFEADKLRERVLAILGSQSP
jgi:nicotinic acid mononucleotide adenylyltransferase